VPNARSIDRAACALVLALVPASSPRAAEHESAQTERASADDSPPALPLPRMPGMTKLSSSARYDAPSRTWKLEAAFRVNAHVPHVLAFYRKALADEGLEIEEPEPVDEAAPRVLVGKSERVHAQIGIRTKPNELETRVWMLWRVRS
jgi:hypothetical protein